MKFPSKRLALSIAAAVCAASVFTLALAQSPAPRPDRPQLPMSLGDAQTRVHDRSSTIDRNRDGFITVEEFAAFRAAKRAERVQRRMARVDTNKDGRVSTTEFEVAHLARFERADANRDGQITRDEVRAMRMQRRAERRERSAQTLRDPNA